jgi:hypothetical protein
MTDKDYWAMFAAAGLAGEYPINACRNADAMLKQMKERFPDPKRHEALFMGTPISELNAEEQIEFEKYKKDFPFPNWEALRD